MASDDRRHGARQGSRGPSSRYRWCWAHEEGTKEATGDVLPGKVVTDAGRALNSWLSPTYVDSWEGERAARGGLAGTWDVLWRQGDDGRLACAKRLSEVPSALRA